MSKFRWQSIYVSVHIALHYLIVIAGLIEIVVNGTFFVMALGVGNVLVLMSFRDLNGMQLLATKYLKNTGPLYYYPRSRINEVADNLWFGGHSEAVNISPVNDSEPATIRKSRWQSAYVKFVWGFFLVGNGLAILEIAVFGTAFMFTLVVPNALQIALLKDCEGKMLFHPKNMKEKFEFSWIPLKSVDLVSDQLFR